MSASASAFEEIAEALEDTGMCGADVMATAKHLIRADELGIFDQGTSRLEWLSKMRFQPPDPPNRILCETLPFTRNTYVVRSSERIGYALMEAAVQIPFPDTPRGVAPYQVVVEGCFPSGALGIWARELGDRGYASIILATSPPRVPHPGGGDPLTGTTPISVCVPDETSGNHVVADLALTERTYGDVLAGEADESMLRFPSMKFWALGIALETMVRTMSYHQNAVLIFLFRPVRTDAVRMQRTRTRKRLPGQR